MDDRRVGLVIRALRRLRGWRQSGLVLGEACRSPRFQSSNAGTWTRCRCGRSGGSFLPSRHAATYIRWRGGSLDRTVDERHADLVDGAGRSLTGLGRDHLPEVMYNIFGDRGSIDLFGFHRATPRCSSSRSRRSSPRSRKRFAASTRRSASRRKSARSGAVRLSPRRQPSCDAGHHRGSPPVHAPPRCARARLSHRERGDPAVAGGAGRVGPRALVSGEYQPL